MNGHSGIGKTRYFRSKYAETMPFGEVKASTEQLQQLLAPQQQYPQATRTDLIALKAMTEAIEDAQLSEAVLRASSTALISASSRTFRCT